MKLLLPLLLLTSSFSFAQNDMKAYRNLSFGENQVSVCRSIQEDPELQLSFIDSCDGLSEDRSGLFFETRVADIPLTAVPEFFENQFFAVFFFETDNLCVTADEIDSSLARKLRTLAAVFENRFGPPVSQNDLNILNMQSVSYATWTQGQKEYVVGALESDARFCATMQITYKPLAEASEDSYNANEEETIDESSDDF